MRTRLFDPVDDPAIVAQVSAQTGKLPAHVFLSMAETVTLVRQRGDRARCAVPSLIIQSRQPFVDPTALATLGDNWDRGVVGSGHFIQVLVPDQVVAMIRRFLEMQLTR